MYKAIKTLKLEVLYPATETSSAVRSVNVNGWPMSMPWVMDDAEIAKIAADEMFVRVKAA